MTPDPWEQLTAERAKQVFADRQTLNAIKAAEDKDARAFCDVAAAMILDNEGELPPGVPLPRYEAVLEKARAWSVTMGWPS